MTTEWFEKTWNLRPIGNSIAAKSEWDYVIAVKKISQEALFEKYREYLAFCKNIERPDKYVKGLANFIRDSDHEGSWKSPATQKFIESLSRNETIDPPIVGKPKSYGAHLQRPITRSDGSNNAKSDGGGQGEGTPPDTGSSI